MTHDKLLQDWILPEAISSGCFGVNSKLKSYSIDKTVKTEGQFASEVIFAELNIQAANKVEIETYNVVIKVQLQNEAFRELVNSSMQFENEILMYTTILPILDQNGIVEDLFCRYYYGHVEPNDPSKDFVILEDLRKYGYRLSEEKLFLDMDHCVITMKQLGKFHALSYMQKVKDLPKLLSAASKIKDKWTKESLQEFEKSLKSGAKRGIQPLIDKGESVELLQSVLNAYNDVVKFFGYLIAPVEPEAVLCHGDFNRNNIFYKYNESGQVTGVKFLDLQTPRYSSPVIDLSFFLLMNTSHSLRKEHLNTLLDIYKESVLSNVSNNAPIPELDFGRVALFGYFYCSFFLPVMMVGSTIDEILTQDSDAKAKETAERGGEPATQALVYIIKDLLNLGYLRNDFAVL